MEKKEKIEAFINPAPKKLYRVVVRASNIEEAMKIIQAHYPAFTEKDLITWHVQKPSTQMKLFGK